MSSMIARRSCVACLYCDNKGVIPKRYYDILEGGEVIDLYCKKCYDERYEEDEEEEDNINFVVRTWDLYGRPNGNFEWDGASSWPCQSYATEAFEGAIETGEFEYSAVSIIMIGDNKEETIEEWETPYELPEEEEEEGETDVESITDN